MTVETMIDALQLEPPLVVNAGRTLRVFYAFSYKVAETAAVPLWASLYPQALVVDREERAQTKTLITLDKALDWQTYQGQVDINVETGTPGGVYGLIVEIPGFKDAQAKLESVIQVLAAPGLFDALGTLATLALLGMAVRMATPKITGDQKK